MNDNLLTYLIEFQSLRNDNALIGHYAGFDVEDDYVVGQYGVFWNKRVPDITALQAYELKNGRFSSMDLTEEEYTDKYCIIESHDILHPSKGLNYHYDYSLLMPVIDKIEKLEDSRYNFIMDKSSVVFHDTKTDNRFTEVGGTRAENAQKLIADFIRMLLFKSKS